VDSLGGNPRELRYYPWGEVRWASGTTPTDYRFTGQMQVASIGLYFYNARWYDSALGRFVQADTIIPSPGQSVAWDRYSYAVNNPIKYVDPTGHISDCSLVAECEDIPIPAAGFNPAPVNDFDNGTGYIYKDGRRTNHLGEDYSEYQGEIVVSPGNGIVVATGSCSYNDSCIYHEDIRNSNTQWGLGNMLIIEIPYESLTQIMRVAAGLHTGQSLYLEYAHLQYPTSLNPGDTVSPGQVLGYVGTTGNSTGPHLHFESRIGQTHALFPGTYEDNRSIFRSFTAIDPHTLESAYDPFYIIPSTPLHPGFYD
jgi:RHS repeat-associated protein